MYIFSGAFCPFCGTELTIEVETHKYVNYEPCPSCLAIWEEESIVGTFRLQGYQEKRKRVLVLI